MKLSLDKCELKQYIQKQLTYFFPDKYEFRGGDVDRAFELALERLEYCYKFLTDTAYNKNSQTFFSHLHGDQYSQFLYYLSNSLWTMSENRPLCDKIMQLNRMLSGMYWSYKAGLPDIFYWSHPVGTVLGNAKYGNFFFCCQYCTVATQVGVNGEIKTFGKGLFLGAGAQIQATNIEIGNRVAIGAGTIVYKEKVLRDDTLIVYRNEHIEQIQRNKEKYNLRFHLFNVEI